MNLVELCLHASVLWKVELISNETRYLIEDISKQSVKGVAWFFLTAYTKMQEEKNEFKMSLGLLNKKEPKLEDLEKSQLAHITKKEKACLKENTMVWWMDHLIRRLVQMFEPWI